MYRIRYENNFEIFLIYEIRVENEELLYKLDKIALQHDIY